MSVEYVREYLCMGSVQAVYKYEAGQNYPQADALMALLELYEADFRDLLYEQMSHCTFPKEGCWLLALTKEAQMSLCMKVINGCACGVRERLWLIYGFAALVGQQVL